MRLVFLAGGGVAWCGCSGAYSTSKSLFGLITLRPLLPLALPLRPLFHPPLPPASEVPHPLYKPHPPVRVVQHKKPHHHDCRQARNDCHRNLHSKDHGKARAKHPRRCRQVLLPCRNLSHDIHKTPSLFAVLVGFWSNLMDILTLPNRFR